MGRLKLHQKIRMVMIVHRRILRKNKVVYLLTAASPVKYKNGRSKIVYIGTTKKGASRIAESAARRAEEIMSTRGLKEVNVFVVSCNPRAGLATWKRLEDALLVQFYSTYHEFPMCNDRGKKKWDKELDALFKQKAIDKVLQRFERPA